MENKNNMDHTYLSAHSDYNWKKKETSGHDYTINTTTKYTSDWDRQAFKLPDAENSFQF